MRDGTRDGFWEAARQAVPDLPEDPPPAWAFGASARQADELLALVLSGDKTATASSRADYEEVGDPLPAPGELAIVLDGRGAPQAVLETTRVEIVRFDEVGSEHARAEGEGDRSLASWRRDHERFWRDHSARGFSPDMHVVCERFRLVHPAPRDPTVDTDGPSAVGASPLPGLGRRPHSTPAEPEDEVTKPRSPNGPRA